MNMDRRAFFNRSLLGSSALGFGGLALAAMLQRDASAESPDGYRPPDGQPHFAPRAKSVIWLFMNGGVSHMESFDPKPMLTKYAGKTIAETPFADAQDPKKLAIERLVVPDGNGNQRNTLYPLQVGFRKHGDSGIEVSDWFPHTARNVDKLAIVRSMWTTDSNHGAQTQFHSGRHQNDGDFRIWARGCIMDWHRSTITCRSTSRWVRASIGTNGMGTTWAQPTMQCRCASIPITRSTLARPSVRCRDKCNRSART